MWNAEFRKGRLKDGDGNLELGVGSWVSCELCEVPVGSVAVGTCMGHLSESESVKVDCELSGGTAGNVEYARNWEVVGGRTSREWRIWNSEMGTVLTQHHKLVVQKSELEKTEPGIRNPQQPIQCSSLKKQCGKPPQMREL